MHSGHTLAALLWAQDDLIELAPEGQETWGFVAVLVVIVAAVVVWALLRRRRHKAELAGLLDRASTDVAWLYEDAVGPAAVADREAHTRDVRQRSDRLHDTLSDLATKGSQEVAAAAVELRGYANELARTLVGRLGDPTADHQHLDVQLSEQRERIRVAHEALEQRVRS
jgi:uncharacterized membrane protein YccC